MMKKIILSGISLCLVMVILVGCDGYDFIFYGENTGIGNMGNYYIPNLGSSNPSGFPGSDIVPSVRVVIEEDTTIPTAQALEFLYEDNYYRYYLSSIRSHIIMLIFEDGLEITLREALESQKITIHDLILNGLSVIKNSLTEDAGRGFHVINGNIHDRHGEILIEVDDYGFTSNWHQISPYFFVVYGGMPAPAQVDEKIYPNAVDRANGTWYLPKDGAVTERVGSDSFRDFTSVPIGTRPFAMTYERPLLRFGFLEGDMPYVDFIIANSTRNREEVRIVGLPVGYVQYFEFTLDFPSLCASDLFYVRVVPRGGHGYARLLVQQLDSR